MWEICFDSDFGRDRHFLMPESVSLLEMKRLVKFKNSHLKI